MFRGKDVDQIEDLRRDGLSLRTISELTGYDRKTIRKYLIGSAGAPV
jgi:transposase